MATRFRFIRVVIILWRSPMPRFCLLGLMLMVGLLTACASVGEAPVTETSPAPAATQTPAPRLVASPTVVPSLPPDMTSNDQTPAPGNPSEYAPQPGDDALLRGQAFVEESGVLTLESFPPQFKLNLTGSVPTPCHQLRIALAPPTAQSQILVEVYTVVNPDLLCTQVLAPFAATVALEGYPVGPTYTVMVNGAWVGEFTPQAP
jgi:hypothetical protein